MRTDQKLQLDHSTHSPSIRMLLLTALFMRRATHAAALITPFVDVADRTITIREVAFGQTVLRRYHRLTRARKLIAWSVLIVIALTVIALVPWEKFEPLHEAAVTPAAAASKGQRQLRFMVPKYEWRVSNCHEREGVDWPGHWRCSVRTIEPACSGWVLLDVYEEDHGAADIWHVQNKVKLCAPWGMFGPDSPDSDWE
jgi:hypothetical protein